MGKGLSELQKCILKIAIKNFCAGSHEYIVPNREVLIEYYGFEPICDLEGKLNRTQIFDRRAIGINRYRSASVAVVKAFNRLIWRRLAQRSYYGGISLTAAGVKAAKAISSKQCKN
jgi:hypothetical protein